MIKFFMKRILVLMIALLAFNFAKAQNSSYDSLKSEILEIQKSVEVIDLRMEKSRQRFQTGILVSTIGYSVTITGGMMLGRKNDSLGQNLLIAGGATGALGTYFLFDAFNILGGKRKNRSKK